MRIGELSKRSGVPVPTIKYYLREGLLPAGVLTSPNQAHYDESHLRRLRLVRALIDVGELSISSVRDALSAIDASDESLHVKLGQVQEAISRAPSTPLDDESVREAEAFIAQYGPLEGYDIECSGVSRMLAAVLSAARSLGHDKFGENLGAYVEGMRIIAEADIEYVMRRATSVDDVVESMVVGTILGDAAMIAVRRLAHAQESAKRIGDSAARASAAREGER
ncbi:MerR family transcriptional regulator [Lentzea tibetensis]|uniref:MerR family transcriptional regulator n=1 Tax=Lentzea tibetensis TaxID=2591470 RepID=A0A563ELS6_9PSEU|nr:MerR family transcriptional regulator [Lentzea tibetensis]TWP48105.1 MerR family transcriptional regulator [Lentzea tibetensis]